MKDFKKFFRGFGKKKTQKQLMKDLIDSNKSLDMNISDRLFDLLEENNNLKEKNLKLFNENKDTVKLIELREKSIKELEKKARQEKSIREMLNNLDNKVDYAIKKIDSLENILSEFKGNIYEVKPIKKCTGSKQKIQIKSSTKNSSIIKKVVGTGEK